MKFKTMYNAVPGKGEVNKLPSMTIPDQTMSIEEMLLRHTRGLPVTGIRVPLYGEEGNESDIGNMELTDKMDLLKRAKEDVERLRNELNQKAHQKRLDEIEGRIRKKIEAEQVVKNQTTGDQLPQ